MDYEPDYQLICDLLDEGFIDTAIKQLDRLLTLHAKAGQTDVMLEILEALHVNYLDVEAIGYRLMLLRKRLGLDDYRDAFFPD